MVRLATGAAYVRRAARRRLLAMTWPPFLAVVARRRRRVFVAAFFRRRVPPFRGFMSRTSRISHLSGNAYRLDNQFTPCEPYDSR